MVQISFSLMDRFILISAITLDKKGVGFICRKILFHTEGIVPMKHYQQLNKEERFYIRSALRTRSTQKEEIVEYNVGMWDLIPKFGF
jgi:hypothetical protein